jgi:hypothetical protein
VKVTRELLEFERAVIAKCRARGLKGNAQIPSEVVDEVVRELGLGRWRARRFVRHCETGARRLGTSPF